MTTPKMTDAEIASLPDFARGLPAIAERELARRPGYPRIVLQAGLVLNLCQALVGQDPTVPERMDDWFPGKLPEWASGLPAMAHQALAEDRIVALVSLEPELVLRICKALAEARKVGDVEVRADAEGSVQFRDMVYRVRAQIGSVNREGLCRLNPATRKLELLGESALDRQTLDRVMDAATEKLVGADRSPTVQR